MTFGGHIVPFVARVVTFAPERNESANVTIQGPQIDNMTRQKSCYYHYHQYTSMHGLINGYECDMGFNIASEA